MIKTYVQAAAQTHLGVPEEKKKVPMGRGKGPSPPVAKPEVSEVFSGATDFPQRFPYVDDLRDYEEEEGEEGGTMVKPVIVHGVPTNWRING